MRGQGWLPLLPKKLPPLGLMLEDIGDPSTDAIAKALDVSRETVQRWIAQEKAPRVVLLALYYVTSWGRSEVNCQAENDASFYYSFVASLRTELAAANAKLARLGQIGDFGSANDPAHEVASRPFVAHTALKPDSGKHASSKGSTAAKRHPKTAGKQSADLAAKGRAKQASDPPKRFG